MAGTSKYNEVHPTPLGRISGTESPQLEGDTVNGVSLEGKRKRVKKRQAAPVRSSGQQGNTNKSTANNMNDWPKSLQDFVSRSFSRAEAELPEHHKPEFNRQMQQLLEMALNQSAIWTTNWGAQKVPILDGVAGLQLAPANIAAPASSVVPSNSYVPPSNSYAPPSTTTYVPPTNGGADYDSQQRKRQRAARFEIDKPITSSPVQDPNVTIVGRCTDLEKNYLRLTTEPNADKVRPQPVLQKSMAYVLKKYHETNNYSYVINQFKSIRQDLTVQHIKNDFTIHVYETNARVSLENNDLGEFNQCQSQLKVLYYEKRKENGKLQFHASEVEFLIYRIIYMMMTSNNGEIYKLKLVFLREYSKYQRTKNEDKLFNFIRDLFQLNQDILLGNYHDFFKIIQQETFELPLAYQLINNYIVNKNRVRALCTIAKSYRKIAAEFIVEELQFRNLTNLVKFLKQYELSSFLVNDLQEFDCVGSRQLLSEIIHRPDFKKVDIKGQI